MKGKQSAGDQTEVSNNTMRPRECGTNPRVVAGNVADLRILVTMNLLKYTTNLFVFRVMVCKSEQIVSFFVIL